MTAKGEYFPKRTRQYVPEMHFSADVAESGFGTIVIPSPSAAGVVVMAGTVAATGFNNLNEPDFIEPTEADFSKYGRTLTVTADAAIVIRGFDYLGQPIVENVATGTDVKTKKAFAFVEGVSAAVGTVVSIKTGGDLGLPYALVKEDKVLVDDVFVASAGTFTTYTKVVQTATTAEPRGLYTPITAQVPDGSKSYAIHGWWLTKNLHGTPHFAG